MSSPGPVPESVEEVSKALDAHGYLADEGLATVIFLAMAMRRPLLLEGEAGVGKTEVAKVLSRWTGGELIRLQCYEGIDSSQAVYEWDYSRQLLHLRAAEVTGTGSGPTTNDLYSEQFLVRRALLRAIDHGQGPPPVLLIDEVDRADDEFEAFLLEVLSDYTITVPELGTFTAKTPPIVILTSNRTRDLHDALKRRCLYHWIDYPDVTRATAIVRRRVPAASADLAENVAAAVARLRTLDVQKPPGIAEAINWVAALELLGIDLLDGTAVERTLGSVMKYREDLDLVAQRGVHWVATGSDESPRPG